MAHQNLIPRGLSLNDSSSLNLLLDDSIVCSELALVRGESRLVHRLYARQAACPTFGGVGWIIDDDISACMVCNREFGLFFRKHHCRSCGDLVCYICSPDLAVINEMVELGPQRVCVQCYWGQYPVHAARSRALAAGSDDSGLFDDDDSFTGRRSFSRNARRRSLDPGPMASSISRSITSPPAHVPKKDTAYNSDDDTQSDSDEAPLAGEQNAVAGQLAALEPKAMMASLQFDFLFCTDDGHPVESAILASRAFSFNDDDIISMAEILSSVRAAVRSVLSEANIEVHAVMRLGANLPSALATLDDALGLAHLRMLRTSEADSVLEQRAWGRLISNNITSIDVFELFVTLLNNFSGNVAFLVTVGGAGDSTGAAAPGPEKEKSSSGGAGDSVSISKEALNILMSLDLSRNASAAEDFASRRRSKKGQAPSAPDPATPARALAGLPSLPESQKENDLEGTSTTAVISTVNSLANSTELSTTNIGANFEEAKTSTPSHPTDELPVAPLNISEEDKALLSYALSGGVPEPGSAADPGGIPPLAISSVSNPLFDLRSPKPVASSSSQPPLAGPRDRLLGPESYYSVLDDEILRSDFDILGSISIGRFLQCYHIKKHLKEGLVSESDVRHIFSRYAEVRKRGSSMTSNGGVSHKTTAELIGLKAFVQAVEAVAEEAEAERTRREAMLRESLSSTGEVDVSSFPEELCDAFKHLSGESDSGGVTLEAFCMWMPIQDAVAEGILEGNAIESHFNAVSGAGASALTLRQFVKLSEVLQKVIDEKLKTDSLKSYLSHAEL